MPANRDEEQPRDLWLDITDFSPGAYNYTPTTYAANTLKNLAAPLGSHDPTGTFSCTSLPNGGLGALPGITASYTWPGAFTSGTNFLVGLLIHDELADGTTEAILISEYDLGSGAGNHKWQAYSYIIESASTNLIVNTAEAGGASGLFGSPYPQFTRASHTNPTTTVGNPVAVFPAGGPASPTNPASGQLYLYPSPAAPGVFGAEPLISPSGGGFTSVAGQALVHQNRILCLSGVNYSYPAGGGFATNEQINFTDPINSDVYGFQQLVLATEEPYGYGCGGSQSAGELFLVKKRGGGVIVTGDLNTPQVTLLPGVQSTGNFYGNAQATPYGLFYCSLNNGAWVWNGSNTSSKVSQRLDDNFFLVPEFFTMGSNNYGFYVNTYGEHVYFSNNWLYNPTTGGWWTYYPRVPQGGVNLFWVQPASAASNVNYIYAAQLSFVNNGQFMYRFDPNTDAQHYQWRSTPLRMTGEDRVMDIREVVVRASTSGSNNSITLSINNKGSSVFTQPQSGTVSTGPDIIRWNVGATGLTEPQIQLNVDVTGGSSKNAIIHQISVRYKLRAHAASTN